MNRIVCVIFIFIAASSISLNAQINNLVFEHIGMEMGLSQSTILTIIQDHEGYLWFGTQEGLNRYDGYHFKVYRNDPYNKNSLSDNWVTTILEDHENVLWIGTNAGGLNRFDCRSNEFTRYQHSEDDPESISSDRILSLSEDSNGQLWIGTDGGGLNLFDKKNECFERYQFRVEDLSETNKNVVTAICEDAHGNLWWGTDGAGLFCLNLKTGEFRHFKHIKDNFNGISSNRILSLLSNDDGTIWIGTNGEGLNRYDPKSDKFTWFLSDPADPTSISNNFVYEIYRDKSGSLWIGTDNGLSQYLKDQDRFYSVRRDPTESSSLSNDMIRSIYEDKGGILWIGTYSGGLNKFDIKKSVFKNISQNPANINSLSDKNVWTILQDDKGYLWVGTNNGLNKIDRRNNHFKHYFHNPQDSSSLSHNLVRFAYQDKAGTIWIGTEGGGLDRYDPESDGFVNYRHNPSDSLSLSDNGLRYIYEDSYGDLWIGTLNGLNKLDRNTQTFHRYIPDPSDPNSLSGNHIRYIYEDRRGALWIGTFSGLNLFIRNENKFISFKNNLSNPSSLSNDRVLCMYEDHSNRFWIGTYGGGLELLDRDEFIFSHFTMNNGLPNDAIYGILEDDKGNLWLSTNKGLSRFNPDKNIFKNFDVNDGIQANEFNGNAFSQNESGEMFFGGVNGFTAFYPLTVQSNHNIPQMVITSFKKYDNEIPVQHSYSDENFIQLSYKDNYLSFEFAALDYTNPAKNEYAYKLEGFDAAWKYSGNRNYASYTNLDGGSYTFRVIGSNNDGLWNREGAMLKIVITPPMWQTWWFKVLIFLILIVSIYLVVMFRMRSVNAQKRKLELEVAQRTRELNQSNYELLRAKKDTDDILNNVEEGLFLISANYELSGGYSLALEDMLNHDDLSNVSFLSLLDKRVSQDVVNSTKEFLDLMFNEEIDEESLQNLNPLVEAEMNLTDSKGSWIHSKYLSFNFRRVYDEQKVQNLIVTVSDITEQVLLSRKLKQSEERTKNQMEWLVNILHLEPELMNEFIEGTEIELKFVDSLLKHGEANGNFKHILEEIYRSIHLIKGNASLLDLQFFADLAHEFEESIVDIQRTKVEHLQGKDFVPLVLHLSEIYQSLNDVKNLINRISNFHTHFTEKRSQENHLLIKSIKNLIRKLSEDLDKEVVLNYEDFRLDLLPTRHRLLLKEILVQLVRNAIYHGIENPETRIKLKKRPFAIIKLSSYLENDLFWVKFRDDGGGIQFDKLLKIASHMGKYKNSKVENWNKEKLANLIFESGFTTETEANKIAGRGIGLDLIKSKLEKRHGKIMVNSQEGKYCEIKFYIPIKIHGRRQSKSTKPRKQVEVSLG